MLRREIAYLLIIALILSLIPEGMVYAAEISTNLTSSSDGTPWGFSTHDGTDDGKDASHDGTDDGQDTSHDGYDVSIPHIIINQIYGAGDGGYVSHSFIELYNQTDKAVDLTGWSIQYCSSPLGGVSSWQKLDLDGKIGANSSFLIRCKASGTPKKAPSSTYSIESYDMDWNMDIYTKGVSVVLLSDDTIISAEVEIFDCEKKIPLLNSYVDMLSVAGNDLTENENPVSYEGSFLSVQSKKKGIRRINFKDTDDNSVDATEVNYDTSDYSNIYPRCGLDGAWGIVDDSDTAILIQAINDIIDTIPKYYQNYCTETTVQRIDNILDIISANDLSQASSADLEEWKCELEDAINELTYKSDQLVPQIYITTDDGSGNSYGDTLTKPIGYVASRIAVVDTNGTTIVDDVEGNIKVRGNATSAGAKKPYNIKFSAKQNLFGFGKAKKWVLLADYYDRTLMRNAMTLDLAENLGLEATPGHKRVEIWVDGAYHGLYLLTEKIEAGKNRVDIDVDNGDFLVELDHPSREEEGNVYFYTDLNKFFRLREPDEDSYTQEQLDAVISHMNELEAVLSSGNYKQVRDIIDEDSFATYYLMNEFVKMHDFAGLSVYFYYKDGVFYAGPAWDYDVSSGYGWLGKTSYEVIYAATCHYYVYLMRYPQFRILVNQKYKENKEIFEELFVDGGWIDQQTTLYQEAITRNYEDAWNYLKQPEYEKEIDYLKSWLNGRYNWFDGYSDGLVNNINGVLRDGDDFLLYIGGKQVETPGLASLDDEYYYLDENAKVVIGTVEVTQTNGVLIPAGTMEFPAGTYEFDGTGRMIVPLEYEKVEEIKQIEPTCIESGVRKHWKISRLSKIYDTESCDHEVMLDDLILPVIDHQYTDKVVASTPTQKGYTLHTCVVCGHTYQDEETEPTGTAVAEVTPSCTEAGIKAHWLDTATGKLYADENYTLETTEEELLIPATGHQYAEEAIAPTVKEKGYTLHTCTACGDTYQDSETEPTGTAVAEVVPLCTKSGIRAHWLDTATGKLYADENYTVETTEAELLIPAAGHQYADEVIAPTVKQAGYTIHTCIVCGDAYRDAETQAVGVAVEEVLPTCTETGLRAHWLDTATGMRYLDADYTVAATEEELRIPAAGHQYIEMQYVKTSNRGGHYEYACSICGDSYQVPVELESGKDNAVDIQEENSGTEETASNIHKYIGTMIKGQKYNFGSGAWTTSDKRIIAIGAKNGSANAKKAGTAILKNMDKATGNVYEYTITVLEPVLSEKKLSLVVGQSEAVALKGVENLPQTWISSDVMVATVSVLQDETGVQQAVISAVGKGTAKITAYVGGVAYTVNVTVKDVAAQKVSADADRTMELRINAFQSVTIRKNSYFKPSGAAWIESDGETALKQDSKGVWTDQSGIISITKTGRLTGTGVGTVTVIGTDSNGNKLTLTVEVSAIPVKSELYVNVGKQTTLKHTYVKNGKNDKIQWTSSEGSVVALENASKAKVTIKGNAVGTSVVTCVYNGVTYTTIVHVEDPTLTTDDRLTPAGGNIAKQNLKYNIALCSGECYDLQQPGVSGLVDWKSSKQDIVSVDEFGRLTARSVGKATISAKVNGQTVKIAVTVK